MKKIMLIVIIGSLILLGSCSLPTRYERDPATPGFGRDDVKKSRCACSMFYQNGEWL